MGNHYNQLTLDERYQIQALHELNGSARSIALKLARSNKTISRELKRLKSGYCAKSAARQAQQRRSLSRKHSVLTDALWHHIDWMMSSTDGSGRKASNTDCLVQVKRTENGLPTTLART